MSQETVERVLGRLITDKRFRLAAADSFDAACMHEGYSLTTGELKLLSCMELPIFDKLADRLDAGLCRAVTSGGPMIAATVQPITQKQAVQVERQ